MRDALWYLARKSERGPRLWFRQTPQGLYGDSLPWLGWIMILLGALLLIYASSQVSFTANWVPWIVGGSFLLTGIVYALSRHSLELNCLERTWCEKRQFLGWTIAQKQGRFSDFRGLVLSKFRRSSLTYPPRFWVVSLEFRDKLDFYDLFWSFNEEKARSRMQELASRMGVEGREQPQD